MQIGPCISRSLLRKVKLSPALLRIRYVGSKRNQRPPHLQIANSTEHPRAQSVDADIRNCGIRDTRQTKEMMFLLVFRDGSQFFFVLRRTPFVAIGAREVLP